MKKLLEGLKELVVPDVRLVTMMLALCATSAWAAPYVMSNADGSAYHWDGGYNWDSGAASPNEITFTLSNPSGVWANGTFPNSGKVALTCISISGRKDGSNADIHHIVLQETGGNSYTSSSVEVLDGASNTENCFVTTLAGGDSDHTYNVAGTYGPGAGQKTVNVYFDNVAVDVTKAITLTTYTAATTKGKLGTSVVTSPQTNTSSWKAAMRVYGTYYYDTDTRVSALNTIIDAASDSEVVFVLADGVEIDVDEAFSTASHTVKIVSVGSITLSAESQPETSYFTNVDFSGVKGGVLRSWLTPGVVGYNFRSSSGSDTSVALISGGTWLPASTANEASGSTTDMFADGLSTFEWSSKETWAYSSGTLLNGYIDDGEHDGKYATIAISNVPYTTYDVIVYAATDTGSGNFRPITVNGTSYTWNSSSGQTVTGNGNWGSSQQLLAEYGTNALRINGLSGPLSVSGGAKSGSSRGGIAAVQIMPAGTLDSDYVLTLDGMATSWSTGTWTLNGETVSAPTVAHSVEIVASASTTLTIDTAATVPHLIIKGTGDAAVTISKGTAVLTTKQVTVESGILKHDADNGQLGSPTSIIVKNGGAMDLANTGSRCYSVKIEGSGVLKDGAYTGALYSSANIGNGSKQLQSITLTGDATIRCDRNWGIINNGYNAATLDIGSYTLTKLGTENFWVCNVNNNASSGTIDVREGYFSPVHSGKACTFSCASMRIASGAHLRMDVDNSNGSGNLIIGSLTLDSGSTVNLPAARTLTAGSITANGTFKPAGTVTCNANMTIGGDVVVPSDKTWTVAGTLTVANGGKLEIKNNALVPGALALADGGTLKIANVSDAAHKVTAGTVTFPASGLATIDVSDIPDIEEDAEVEVLAGSTSLPADVSTLRIVGKKYSLESESNTLKVVNDGGLVWNSTDGWTKDVSKYGDATITSPGTIALGGTSLSFENVTLSGSGTVSFSATGSEKVTIKNLEIGSGVTLTANAALDLTGCTITGDGTLDIPVGTTYAMNGVSCSAKVTVEGTLETSGTTSLSGANTSASGSLIEVVDGTTALSCQYAQLNGNITVDADAVLNVGSSLSGNTNYSLNHINPYGTLTITIKGTLDFGSLNCWEMGAGITFNLYAGATLRGSNGASYGGTLAWVGNGTINVYGNSTIDGNVIVDCVIRTATSADLTVNIAEKAIVEINKSFVGQAVTASYCAVNSSSGGSITKTGAGTLKFTQDTLTKPMTISAGKVQLKKAFTSGLAISIASGAELELGVGLGSSDANVTSISFAGLTGDGTIRYSSEHTGYYTQATSAANMFATTLHVANDNTGKGVVIGWSGGVTTNRTVSGSGKYRSDWGGSSGVADRYFLALQDDDSEWGGIFHEDDRMHGMKVAGVEGAAHKTLTLSGVQTQTNTLEIEPNGSANLTGTWVGDTTVNGEFGGTGNITGALTLNAGSTFKVWATDVDGLVATGALTLPVSGKVTVDVSDLTLESNISYPILTVASGLSNTSSFADLDSETHMLSVSSGTLYVVPIAATVTSGSSVTKCSSVDAAIGTMVMGGDKDAYVTVLNGTTTYTAEELAGYNIIYDSSDSTYSIAAAQIESEKYGTVAKAIAGAEDSGDTITLLRNCTTENLSLGGKSVTFDEDEYTFSGSFTGNGTITLSAMLKAASSDRWADGWEGVVVLPNLDSIAGSSFSFNDYGISGSTVRVTTIGGGWVKNETVNPTIDVETSLTLTDFSAGNNNTFTKITGSGALNLSCNESAIFVDANTWYSTYSAYFLVNDLSGFSGSISVSNLGLAIGDSKPDYKTAGNKIIVNSGKTATVGASSTWTATTIQVDGALTVSNTSTLTGTVTGGGTIAYASGAVPADSTTAPTFDSTLWTGIVELPVFSAAGIKLAEYGTRNSKIKINGITGGYLYWENQDIKSEVVLAGDVRITATSHRDYTYAYISGTGSFSVSNSNTSDADPASLVITKLDVAAGSVGMAVTNNTSTTLIITTLALPEGASVAAGTKLLTIGGSGSFSVGSVTVGGVTQTGLPLAYTANDGIYVKTVATVGGVPYAFLEDALAIDNATIVLASDVSGDITLKPGQILVLGVNTVSGTIGGAVGEVTDGIVIYNYAPGVYCCIDNRTSNWIGASGASWNAPTCWSNGMVVPGEHTAVSITAFAGDVTTGSITLSGDATVKSVTFGSGVALTLNAASETTPTLTVSEAIYLTSGQTITLGTGVTLSATLDTHDARSRVVYDEATKTYSVQVIPGTIFSVW